MALGSAVLFGAAVALSKLLTGSIDPWLLAGILYLGAGSGLAIVHWGRGFIGLPSLEASVQRSDLPWLAAVVVFGGVLGPLLLMLGLSQTSASSGALLLNVEGLATMLIAWMIFRENVDSRLVAGAMAILAGAALLSWTGDGFSLDSGSLLVVAACVCWGVDNNLTRKLSASDPVQIAMIKGLAAGTTNLMLALAVGATLPSATLVAAGAVVGLLGVGVSLVTFMLALRHLGTARTGAYFSLAPFIGAVVALVLFREPITGQLVAAAALMGLGLWLHLREVHEHEHTHDPIEHDHLHTHDHHHDHHREGAVVEPHSHWHRHDPLRHSHPHYPDLHHRHGHG